MLGFRNYDTTAVVYSSSVICCVVFNFLEFFFVAVAGSSVFCYDGPVASPSCQRDQTRTCARWADLKR